MAKRKSSSKTSVQQILFEDTTIVTKRTAEDKKTSSKKEDMPYSSFGMSGDMDAFSDYIKNGRNNSISWKPQKK